MAPAEPPRRFSFKGSDGALERVEKMITQWERTRTGRFEEFAEFAVKAESRDLDILLEEFARLPS